MARIYNDPINPPTLDADRLPLLFQWRRRRYRVLQVLDSWSETGQWWDQEPELAVWRVLCEGGAVMELAHELGGAGRWLVYKVYD